MKLSTIIVILATLILTYAAVLIDRHNMRPLRTIVTINPAHRIVVIEFEDSERQCAAVQFDPPENNGEWTGAIGPIGISEWVTTNTIYRMEK